MAQEIEKKYLVLKNKLPKLKNGVLYIQGYFCFNPLIRFRIIENNVCINIKKIRGEGYIRDEWEFCNKLNKKDIEKLIKISVKKPVQKIRYKIKHKQLVWEIDIYKKENRGLITADVELPNKNYNIQFPVWIDKNKDITNDKKYFNRNLGENPYGCFKDKP